jgi:hypothetical protein
MRLGQFQLAHAVAAATICALYKSRWYGRTSLERGEGSHWIAVSLYVPVGIAKKVPGVRRSLHTLLQRFLRRLSSRKRPIYRRFRRSPFELRPNLAPVGVLSHFLTAPVHLDAVAAATVSDDQA